MIADMLHACKYENYVYIGVPKNSLISHLGFLEKSGWSREHLNMMCAKRADYKFWGHIRNPHRRHTKGLAEYLNKKYIKEGGARYALDLMEKYDFFLDSIISGLYDEHTFPISLALHPNIDIDHINWIPLDTNIQSEDLTNEFFKLEGLDFDISNHKRANVSLYDKLKLQETIDERKQQSELYKYYFTNSLLKKDICVYNDSIVRWSERINQPEMLSYLIQEEI